MDHKKHRRCTANKSSSQPLECTCEKNSKFLYSYDYSTRVHLYFISINVAQDPAVYKMQTVVVTWYNSYGVKPQKL